MTEQSFDKAFARVSELVADFHKHEKAYLLPSYSEQDVRKDFIDKFWIALGWDVNHEVQKNPNEQEVKVERGVDVEGRVKKADYAFLTPNFRDVRFFVEAKKPARNIDNSDDYFQTIRYGWNAQAAVSILTDFEHFRVLDCRLKPDITTARDRALPKFSLHYTDYADREKFAEIYYLFSREAAHAGKLEQFAAAMPKPTGKATKRRLFAEAYKAVDEEFLRELDEMRGELARSFKNRNPRMNGEELTEATQRTLDRLVFMRFLEDKLIEPEPMVEKFGDNGSAWGDFIAQSERLNRIYNGIIFKPHFIDEADFVVDEKVFASVRERLAHTNTVYNFNYIPIHVLGSIYERFLGNVIVATDKQATVAPKPEVRKAGGVYYTPEYIVRYIVAETVGKMIEGKKPAEIAEMRFADIACGSGSFLLGIFDELLRYHTAYYNRTKANRAAGVRAGCIENADGTLRLSLQQKKAILTKNIYGVDLDAQAVEVAQLSLFLRLLEDETTASAKGHQLEFRETMLPDLRTNIKHGNSLIDWDISSGLFDDEEERKLHPMDFAQAFPDVMRRGGFDAIVGNPPYGAELTIHAKKYLINKFPVVQKTLDSYCLFMLQSLNLLRNDGVISLIVPNTFCDLESCDDFRYWLLSNNQLDSIWQSGWAFKAAVVDTLVYVITKKEPEDKAQVLIKVNSSKYHRAIAEFLANHLYKIDYRNSSEDGRLLNKVAKLSIPLSNIASVKAGVKMYEKGKGIPPQTDETMKSRPFSAKVRIEGWKSLYRGEDINRYLIGEPREFVNYGAWLAAPRTPTLFQSPKILMRRTDDRLFSCLELESAICVNSCHVIKFNSEDQSMSYSYLLGLLNSRMMQRIFEIQNPQMVKKVFAEIKVIYVERLPIRTINFSDKADCARHDRMVSLVTSMLAAKRQLQAARTDRDRSHYEAKCVALDRQIDELVYELYELTDEERKVIENE